MFQGMAHRGLFIGITTLDLIYQTDRPMSTNLKFVATDFAIAAGGPATNAAIAFQSLGNQAQILSGLGQHSMTQMVREDLNAQGVQHLDALPNLPMPPISSIVVDASTGDRTVISRNVVDHQAPVDPIESQIPTLLENTDIILVDGHQIALSLVIARQAQAKGIPVVLDGGSWKFGLEVLLPFIDYAICSANFYPPDCDSQAQVFAYLREQAANIQVAITRGGESILYGWQKQSGEIPVPVIQPVDTLGAGDAFHGAFCHWILQIGFREALQKSAVVAAIACQSFGTRNWLKRLQ
jgi:sugar/nucleoside kinase (ribokinase family)